MEGTWNNKKKWRAQKHKMNQHCLLADVTQILYTFIDHPCLEHSIMMANMSVCEEWRDEAIVSFVFQHRFKRKEDLHQISKHIYYYFLFDFG